MEELTKEIEYSLRHIAGRIKMKGRVELKAYDITTPQFIAMQWINETKDLTLGDLSKKLYLAYSTTTDIIDKLEEKELVTRIQSKEDKRVFHVKILEKGKALIEEVISARQSYTDKLLKDMNQTDKESLNKALDFMLMRMRSEDYE